MPFRRLIHFSLAGIALYVLPACGPPERPLGHLPDVVLVTLDTTRADYMSCYGFPEETTPCLDAFAAENLLFERCVSSSGITPVSHASILTGLEPYEHGLRIFSGWSGYRLPSEVPTLATALKQRGYTTIAIHSAFPVSAAFGFDNGFDVFDSFSADFVHDLAGRPGRVRLPVSQYQRRSDATTEIALRAVAETEGPVFLWVHYFDAHDQKLLPPTESLPPGVAERPLGDPGRREALYAAEIRFQDRQLERLFAGLERSGRFEGAAVVVVADHGQGLADGKERHGWSEHAILYQEQLHVPLVMKLPGAGGGVRVSDLVRTTDILPTLFDYLDYAAPGELSGRSLRDVIEGNPTGPRTAYAEMLNGYEVRAIAPSRPQADFAYSVQAGDWKLIYRPTRAHESELYHLANDPGETQNLFGERPLEAHRLLRDLARRVPWATESPAAYPEDPDPSLSSAMVALGYAQGDRRIIDPKWAWRCCGPIQDEAGSCSRCGEPRVLVARR